MDIKKAWESAKLVSEKHYQFPSKKECEYCLGSGVKAIPNGDSDFDEDFCHCPAGEAFRELSDKIAE